MTTALVAAIEPDREQAARLSGIVRGRLGAELVLAESVARALAALGERIPDLILTPALLSTRDEAALSARLRDLGSAAAHVQTLTVPRIGGAAAESAGSGIFKRFRRAKSAATAAAGCEPDVFAQQVSAYLQRARADRSSTIAPALVEPVILEPIEEPVLDPVIEPQLEDIIPAPSFAAIEPELIALAGPEPACEPLILSAPEPIVEPPVVTPEPIPPPPGLWRGLAVALRAEAGLVSSEAFVEQIVAPPIVEEEVVMAPPIVEEAAAALPAVQGLFVPLPIVEEFAPMVAVEQFVGPPAIAEELVEPVTVVEEPVESVAVLEQLAEPVAAVEEPVTPAVTIEEPIEPEPIAEPMAVAPVLAAEAPSEPLFSVEDIDLEFWIADEPAAAPVEATVVPSGQVEDDRFYIAAQDFSDLDMSTLLDGLVLPEAATAAAPAPGAPTATASMEPERTAEPAPVPARTKLPSKRHVPVHDRAPEPNAARRRRTTPVQDEWGLFDPEQCGFAALIAKLDAVTDDEEAGKRRGTQTRVVSYN